MNRIAVDASEEAPVAPLIVVDARVVATLHDRAVGFQRGERNLRRLGLEPERRGERGLRDRSDALEPPTQNFGQRLLARPNLRPFVRRGGDLRVEARLRP